MEPETSLEEKKTGQGYYRCAEFEVLLEGSVILESNGQDQESCFHSVMVSGRNIREQGAFAQEVTWYARE